MHALGKTLLFSWEIVTTKSCSLFRVEYGGVYVHLPSLVLAVLEKAASYSHLPCPRRRLIVQGEKGKKV